MATQVRTTGGAVLGLLTGVVRAVATGLSAAKEVDEGCGSCPDDQADEAPRTRSPRIQYTRRRRRRK